MDAILARLPDNDWFHRNRGKLVGLFAGTIGTVILTLFLVVLLTGEPYGRDMPLPPKVYDLI